MFLVSFCRTIGTKRSVAREPYPGPFFSLEHVKGVAEPFLHRFLDLPLTG